MVAANTARGGGKDLEFTEPVFFPVQVRGEEEDQTQFDKFGRLDPQAEELNPTIGVLYGGHEKGDGKKEQGQNQKRINERGVLIERPSEGKHGDDDQQAQAGP